jgi:outer membrane protein assembly factor BamD (BamD/ComL family)
MKDRIRVRMAAFILLALIASMIGDRSFARTKDRRDQTLFLGAANSIASGKYAEAIVLLKTLIYTYPDSPFGSASKASCFLFGRPRGESAN